MPFSFSSFEGQLYSHLNPNQKTQGKSHPLFCPIFLPSYLEIKSSFEQICPLIGKPNFSTLSPLNGLPPIDLCAWKKSGHFSPFFVVFKNEICRSGKILLKNETLPLNLGCLPWSSFPPFVSLTFIFCSCFLFVRKLWNPLGTHSVLS